MKMTKRFEIKKINTEKIKNYFYRCEVCGREIESYEYYAYGKCWRCR